MQDLVTHMELKSALNSLNLYIDEECHSGAIKHYNDYYNLFARTNVAEALIRMQKPDATLVASRSTWLKVGQKVKRSSFPIIVFDRQFGFQRHYDLSQVEPLETSFCSVHELEEFVSVRSFQGYQVEVDKVRLTAKVFGSPISSAKSLEGEAPREFLEFVNEQAELINAKITYEDFNGSYGMVKVGFTGKPIITISSQVSPAHQARTLLHEIVHYKMGHTHGVSNGMNLRTEGDLEIVAEASTYLIAKTFGFDTSLYSKPYIAEWAGNDSGRLGELLRDKVAPFCKELLIK